VLKTKKLYFYECLAIHVLAVRLSILLSTENYYYYEIKWDGWGMQQAWNKREIYKYFVDKLKERKLLGCNMILDLKKHGGS